MTLVPNSACNQIYKTRSNRALNRINRHLLIVDDDCVILADDEEENDASMENKSESNPPSRSNRKRDVRELEKFGDDVDSDENNKYNYDDDFTPDTREDAELTQLRDDYEEDLANQSHQISNFSCNSHAQFNVLPLHPQS